MIERAPPFALRQPEQAERAMAAVVLRLDGAGAAVALDGVARAAARFERGRAIVMRGGVARLGGDRRVEMTDRVGVLALRGGEDAEVVGDGAVAGRHAQRRAIRSLRLVEPARLVQGDRVRDQLLELACCQCVHGPVGVLRDVDGKPPPARRGHARCQLYGTGTHARTACRFGYMAGPATEDKRSDTTTAVSGR